IGAFCLFFFLGFSEETAFIFFFGVFLGSMLGYFFYNNKLEPFRFDFNLDYFKKDNLWLRFLVYSFFGFLGNIGSFLALKIANVMIGEYISFEQNGLYSNIYSIAALIMVPQMGLYNISAPIINRHLADNTLEELDGFHKKTSLSLFFLGLVLFSCIVVGFPFLAGFMKNGEMLKQSQFILWIIGFAMLFDLATGFNSHIISLSNLYRYNTFFMLILACLTIGLNTLFLKFTDFGILGIAVSYAVSLTTFNLIKIIFNYHHFRVFPLSAKMLSALLVCFLAVFSAVLLPEFKTNLLNLIYKPAWVLLVVFSGNYFLKIYPLDKFLNKGFLSSLWKKP
ncbi:MAG: polysaccharide biosynthesis protein, partial [Riemerella sp.]|nr:polysaccharide biosynthesis protein [Riemerella sp.]